MGEKFVPRKPRPMLNLLDLLFQGLLPTLLLPTSRFRLMNRLQLRRFFLQLAMDIVRYRNKFLQDFLLKEKFDEKLLCGLLLFS